MTKPNLNKKIVQDKYAKINQCDKMNQQLYNCNAEKFSAEKQRSHFTDEYLKENKK